MPELVIKYRNKRTLEALLDFSKYFDFSVVLPKKKSDDRIIEYNGVTLIKADDSIDVSGLEKIFTNRNIDHKKLRRETWKRNM